MKFIIKQLFSLILPVTAIVIVPLLIEQNLTIKTGLLSAIGMIILSAGMILIVITVSMFMRIGRGTLAPWSPTRNLVKTGVYAHVRNPMISGVCIVLVGESMLFQSVIILIWAMIFFVFNTVYFKLSEEPGLEERFGDEYREYRQNVPRWVPRVKPWAPSDENRFNS